MQNKQLLNTPQVFITGAGRSGTTLLSNLLQNHPKIISLPEATFIFGLISHFGNKDIKKFQDEFINALWIRRDYNKPMWDIDENKLRNYFQSHEGYLCYEDALKYCFFSSKRAIGKQNVEVVINKHPEFSWYLPLIFELFPNAKIIVLIRDYRDRYLSIKENFEFSFFNHLSNGISWFHNYQLIEKSKIIYPSNFLFIKYEDLIQNKLESINSILEFIGIEKELDDQLFVKPQMDFKISESEFGKNIAYHFNKTHNNSSKEIIKNNFNKWESKLSDFEVKTLEYFCGEKGKQFNYMPKYKLSVWDVIKIELKVRPVFWINRFLFKVMRFSFQWPLSLQGFIYNLVKQRANKI